MYQNFLFLQYFVHLDAQNTADFEIFGAFHGKFARIKTQCPPLGASSQCGLEPVGSPAVFLLGL